MKEELISLKDSAIKIMEAREGFKKQKMFFNMKVEEQKNILGTEEVFNINNDSYEAAKILNEELSWLHLIVSELKEQHPKYGNKRIKQLVLQGIVSIPEEYEELIDRIVDDYMLYESCGFFKVNQLENEIIELEENAKTSTKVILGESKEAVRKAGNSVKNVVKPYGEIAKSQLQDAKVAAKGAVNKGSKQLIKLFQKIEKNTNNEDKK